MNNTIKRNRLYYAVITAIVIAVGLTSRSNLADSWPPFLSTYSGDALWTLMIFLGLGFLFPRLGTFTIAVATLLFAFCIEILQLYQAPWINSCRETFIGASILGFGFLWSDFVCYTTGVAVGALGETIIFKKESANRSKMLRMLAQTETQ